MQKIKFLGAAGGVTGSGYLVTGANGDQVLVDLGMFQGIDDTSNHNSLPLSFNAANLQAVFLTHAHLDHCGRLPLLIKQGFKGKIYTTEATKEITHLSLLDAAEIAKERRSGPVLYTKEDVDGTFSRIESVSYDQPFSVGSFSVCFRNAGHILGSASIEISENSKTIVFSGDLGNSPEDLITPTEKINHADVVVMESTYGDRIHPNQDAQALLQQEINQVENTSGVLLIPAFSIERTQEILHLISHLKLDGKISHVTPVFLDSPMAIGVTEIFKKFPNLYNQELSKDTHPFDFASLTLTKSADESKGIAKVSGSKIIIAGSGMMDGGRILHHLNNYISLPTTRLMIVGYQAKGTLGREILEGKKQVKIYDQYLEVKAIVTNIQALSSHADQSKLLLWLKYIQGVGQVFLVHGEESARTILAEKIKTETNIKEIILPEMNQEFEVN